MERKLSNKAIVSLARQNKKLREAFVGIKKALLLAHKDAISVATDVLLIKYYINELKNNNILLDDFYDTLEKRCLLCKEKIRSIPQEAFLSIESYLNKECIDIYEGESSFNNGVVSLYSEMIGKSPRTIFNYLKIFKATHPEVYDKKKVNIDLVEYIEGGELLSPDNDIVMDYINEVLQDEIFCNIREFNKMKDISFDTLENILNYVSKIKWP